MTARPKRRVAVFVVALLTFAQANVAFSGCAIDRGAMGPAMASSDGMSTSECDGPRTGTMPQNPNLCAVHCAWDLQTAGVAVALVQSPRDLPILVVARSQPATEPRTGLSAPPSGAPPHRILLHSFLI